MNREPPKAIVGSLGLLSVGPERATSPSAQPPDSSYFRLSQVPRITHEVPGHVVTPACAPPGIAIEGVVLERSTVLDAMGPDPHQVAPRV